MEKEFKKIGKSGGFNIPVKLRRELGIYSGDAVAVERTADGGVIIKPYNKRCALCGSIDGEGMAEVDGKGVCGSCVKKIRKAAGK